MKRAGVIYTLPPIPFVQLIVLYTRKEKEKKSSSELQFLRTLARFKKSSVLLKTRHGSESHMSAHQWETFLLATMTEKINLLIARRCKLGMLPIMAGQPCNNAAKNENRKSFSQQ